MENTPVSCDVTADKQDIETGDEAQGDAVLEGATYGLYAAEDIQYPDGSGVVTYKEEDPITSIKGTDFQYLEVPATKDTLLATVKTDQDSDFAFGNLYLGSYYIKEIEESEGYQLDATVYDVDFRDAENTHQDISLTREVTETPDKQPFQIIKVSTDGENGETDQVEGAEFTVKLQSDIDRNGWENAKTYDVLVTDETGTVTTPLQLKYGVYELTEIKAPEGYLLTEESLPFTVTKEGAVEVLADEEGDPVITVVMENQPVKGSIKIHKEGEVLAGAEYDTIIDRILTAVTGDERSVSFQYETIPLEGAVYHLIADEDIYTPDHQTDGEGNRKIAVIDDIPATSGSVIAVMTTDENGEAEVQDLPLGKYRIEEVEAPEGFVLDETAKQIELTYADEHTEVVYEEAEFTDERVKTALSLIKKNSVNEVPVEGAVYGVYATADIGSKDGEVLVEADSLIESVETDAEGKAVFEADLPPGRYYVKEVGTAPGYLMDESEYEVDFTCQDPKQAVLMEEIAISEIPAIVEVFKSDVTTGKEIAGAKLEILDENGEVYAAWTTDGTPYTLNAIPAGDYTLRETFAPYGYMIANEAAFTVEETGEIQKVSMKDERVKGYVEIYKTDSRTKKAIEGVTFELRDKKGNVVEKLVTDKKGYARSKELDICTYQDNGEYDQDIPYVVVETKAADGYVPDSKEHKAVIKYTGLTDQPVGLELHITNKPKDKKLPQTGGDYEPWRFLAVGGAFVIGGIVMYFRRRKSRKPGRKAKK